MVRGRTWWVILVLGLVALGVAPFAFTATSWKQGLAGFFASFLAIWWVLFWWAIRDPGRRIPKVATVLGMIGGLVLGGLGAGLYCEVTDCSAGFDALFLLPFWALLGAFVGGEIGHLVIQRLGRGSHGPHPGRRPDGSAS